MADRDETKRKVVVDLYGKQSIWAQEVRWKTQTCELDGKLTVLLKAVL